MEKKGGIRQTLSLHNIFQVSPKMVENCAKPVAQKLPQPSYCGVLYVVRHELPPGGAFWPASLTRFTEYCTLLLPPSAL